MRKTARKHAGALPDAESDSDVQPGPTNQQLIESTPVETQTETLTPTETATATTAATNTATTTPEPTQTLQPTNTSRPTSTVAPATPVVTASPALSTRQSAAILAATGTPTELSGSDTGGPVQAGDEQIGGIEAVEVTASATAAVSGAAKLVLIPTSTPTPEPKTYTIETGDTFISIANRLDVSTAALMLANEMSPDEARLIRPGQILLIPDSAISAESKTDTPAPTETQPPATAAATRAPTATPTPAGPAYRLDAPVLRSPENNTPVSCNGNNQLNWITVAFMQPDDQFVMHLGFVSGVDGAGTENVIWILAQPPPQ